MPRCPTCHRRVASACPDHGPVAPPAPTPLRRIAIPNLTLDQPVGVGGSAIVWSAGTAVVKIAHAPGRTLAHEAAFLERLASCPAITRLLDRGTLDDRDYLVLERAPGHSLAHALELGNIDLLATLDSLARAIDALHAAGVVHCDLKPENLFVDGARCTIIDFGTARLVGDRPDTPGAAITTGERPGTPYYMAPEQVCAEGRPITAALDIYALGAIAFELACGRPPFVGSAATVKHGHAFDRPPRASSLAPVTPAIDAAIQVCLAKDPRARFATAAAAVAAMCEAPLASVAPRKRAPSRGDRDAPQRHAVTLLAIVGAPSADVTAAVAIDTGATIARHGDPVVVVFADREPAAGVRAAIRIAQRVPAAQHTIHRAEVDLAAGRPRGAAIANPSWAIRRATLAESAAIAKSVDIAADPRTELPPSGSYLRRTYELDRVVSATTSTPPTPIDSTAALGSAIRSSSRDPHDGPREFILLTDIAASVLEAGLVRPTAEAGYHAPIELADEQPPEAPIVGRDSLIAKLVAEARAALSSTTALLRAFAGEPGAGKTRLLRELARALASVELGGGEPKHASTRVGLDGVLWLSATGAPILALVARALDVPESALPEAARARLPEPAWAALRIALGAAAPDVAAVSTMLQAPGSLRLTAAVALGRALREASLREPLVVFVDDAHRIDPLVLDTLEAATAGPAKIVVVASAPPEVLERRPAWREAIEALPPLDANAAEQLVRALLWPVELVPREIVDELVVWASGNPLAIVELVTRLRGSGAVRRQRGTQSWFVASTMVDVVRELGVGQASAIAMLAAHEIDQLPADLRAFARACAIADEPIDGAVLARIIDEVEETIEVDCGSGLERLVRHRVLERASDGLRFRMPLARERLAAELPRRARERLHAAFARTLDPWSGTRLAALDDRELASLAAHARAAGRPAVAARASLELAEWASARHRYVEAERAATDAIATLEDRGEHAAAAAIATVEVRGELTAAAEIATLDRGERAAAAIATPGERRARARAHLLRARARYRGDRFLDALDDARAARETDDSIAVAEAALEECTILDWGNQWAEAARATEQARAIVAAASDPRGELAARLALAEGRVLLRAAKHLEAREALTGAVAAGDRAGHYETSVIARLLLAVEHSALDETDQADRVLDDVFARTRAANDLVHLAAAHNNRVIVRCVRKDLAGALEDLNASISIAREIGNVIQEYVCRYNLGELLIWMGRLDEADATARLAFELCLRHDPVPIPHVGVLRARVEIARHRFEAAREHVAWVDARWALADLPADIAVFRRMALAAIAHAPVAEWAEVVEAARGMTGNEQLEVIHAAVGSTGDPGLRTTAQDLAAGDPVWACRFGG